MGRSWFTWRSSRGVLLGVWLSTAVTHPQVRINEFLADNATGLRTKAGDAADWIELFNAGPGPVNIGGWYLTDDATALSKWRVPDGTVIPGNGYLVVFADSCSLSITNGELHANFSLAKEGEYLALVGPDGTTVIDEFAPRYPPQLQDVSYGRGAPAERELLGAGSKARYRIPNAGGTSSWVDARGALGFTALRGYFTVRYYEMNSSIANVDAAELMVTNKSYWKNDRTYPLVAQHQIIDFHANSASGYFTNNVLFPGHSYAGQDKDNFVIVAEGTIYVPAPGMWTFAVGSDDGFRLRMTGHGVEFGSEYPTGRSFAVTLATFNFPVAGCYDLYLIYYENYGGASVEFSAAEGYQETFSPDVFKLVGDPAGDIVHAGAIGSLIDTDVSASMKDINGRLDGEWTFVLPEAPAPEAILTLWVRCADGFRASLNGVPVAELNVPPELSWNSTATTARPLQDVLTWLSYPIPPGVVRAGTNTLAICALNNSASDPDFLIAPRITSRRAKLEDAYFKRPTPGAPNTEAYAPPTPVVIVSEPRGYKTNPFVVRLTTASGTHEIRYTLDGSTPTTNSTLYTGPFTVSRTTVLRAAVVDPASVRQNVTTVTWLFLNDILQQGSNPPPGWPASRQVNNHVMEYGMRQDIVANDRDRLCRGMTSTIATISLVTDLPNLFDPQRGIYVNPANDGIAWERPVSVELIDPVNGSSAEFQIDAGLRIRGAYLSLIHI
ncbi:MAG: lamin tail domain-containing protein, partial [Verrucomicrobiae bacterium]|nr:lamin tail domain-containing protein [Verrucomicrobiae bacterium]